MKITSFSPLIMTNDSENVGKLFEELGFEKRHEKKNVTENNDSGFRKLANMRSLASGYSEYGERLWDRFHQHDPEMHHWYYQTIAEQLELSLNKTGAFKEFIKHINFIWPGSFDSEKARYRKYREVSVVGCKQIGHGAKGDVYRYECHS